MYLFEAHYINMDTNEKVIRKIEFDGQFFDSEKEIYLYAMGKAYDMIEDNECFDILEFIFGSTNSFRVDSSFLET